MDEEIGLDNNEEGNNPNELRDQMLGELETLKELISNHPDTKLKYLSDEEKKVFQEFLKFYSFCPLCKRRNHQISIKKFYFDENHAELKKELIKLMELKKNNNMSVGIGILCCSCFDKFF